MERAAGYAVPILQTGMEVDPLQTLLMGTALTRAGITSTKSGTWVRNMMQNALPGTSLMSKMAFKKHEESLKELGLIDGQDNPTWFTDGKPDPFKLLEIGASHAAGIPLIKRAAYEKALFGVQGEGAFSVLSDPKVMEQIKALHDEMGGPEFKNKYATFMGDYAKNSPVQQGRQAWGDATNLLTDIGLSALPPVVAGLGALDAVLKAMKGTIGESGTGGIVASGLAAAALSMTGWGRSLLSKGWNVLGGMIGAGASLGTLPNAIAAATDDFRTPEAKANDAAFAKYLSEHFRITDPLAAGNLDDTSINQAYARQRDMHPIIRGERDMEGARARALSNLPPPPVNVTLQNNIKVLVDGKEIAARIIAEALTSAGLSTRAPGFDTHANYAGPDYATANT